MGATGKFYTEKGHDVSHTYQGHFGCCAESNLGSTGQTNWEDTAEILEKTVVAWTGELAWGGGQVLRSSQILESRANRIC